MKTSIRGLTAALSGLLLLATTAEARADQKQECAAAYVATQSLRDEDKLLDARQQALACNKEQCPAFIRAECAQWLGEIEVLIPTVVFTIEGTSGAETQAIRLTLDGQAISEWSNGQAVPMSSGRHHARFELAGAGAIEKEFVAQVGEKNRKVVVFFKRKPAEPAPPPVSVVPETRATPPAGQVVLPPPVVPAASPAPEAIEPQTASTTTIPVWAWISVGTGVALLSTGVALSSESSSDEGHAVVPLAATGVIGILAGVLGIIVGQTSTPNTPKTVSFTPFASPTVSGLSAYGRF